jgi:hypothetical protein
MAANWMADVPGFRAFAREVILDSNGWARQLGLERAMRAYFDAGKAGYRFPHPLSIFSIVAWRLLLLTLWSRHYLKAPLEVVSPALPAVRLLESTVRGFSTNE